MSKKILLILIITSSFNLFSQKNKVRSNIDFEFGTPFKLPKKHRDLGFVGSEKNGYSQLSIKVGTDIVVQTLNEQYFPISEESVDISDVGKGFSSEKFLQLKENYFWYYSTWNREEQREYLHFRPFDLKNNRFSDEHQTIIKANKLAGAFTGKYSFNTSSDKSKLLITYRIKPLEKSDKINHDIIGFNVFDHNMNKLWANELKMPYTEKEMDNMDYEISSSGKVYMLAKVFEPKEEMKGKDKRKESNYHFELFSITENNSSPEIYKLDLDSRFISSVILNEDNQGNLYAVGYYTNKKMSVGADGAFTIKLELKNNEINTVSKNFYEFPISLLKQFASDKAQKKLDKKAEKNKEKNGDDGIELQNLELDKVVFDEDGSIIIIGEEFYTHTVCTTDSRGVTTCRTYYHYQNIIVMKISNEGKVMWANKIPKNQVGGAFVGGMSYHHHLKNGENYFFYLDNIKNIDLPLNKYPAGHRDGAGGFLTCIKMDKEGKMTKEAVFDSREQKVRVYPINFESVSKNKVLTRVYGKKRKSKVLAINFN